MANLWQSLLFPLTSLFFHFYPSVSSAFSISAYNCVLSSVFFLFFLHFPWIVWLVWCGFAMASLFFFPLRLVFFCASPARCITRSLCT